MRVIVPYTRLHPSAAERLDAYAPGRHLMHINPADSAAYWDLLDTEWCTPGDLAIIEHDVGIHAGVLPGFRECPELWCAHEYNIAGRMLACLGCTRFRAELKAAVPDLFARMDALPFDGSPPRVWDRLDVRLAEVLADLGYAPHIHHPTVAHYHIYT